jgi:hypothetical protein
VTVRNPTSSAAVALTGYFRANPHEALFWDNPFDHDVQMMRANSPILCAATLPPAVCHCLHVVIYDGAYTSRARAVVRQLARSGVPAYWDSRVTEPTGVLYHTWTYRHDSARCPNPPECAVPGRACSDRLAVKGRRGPRWTWSSGMERRSALAHPGSRLPGKWPWSWPRASGARHVSACRGRLRLKPLGKDRRLKPQ